MLPGQDAKSTPTVMTTPVSSEGPVITTIPTFSPTPSATASPSPTPWPFSERFHELEQARIGVMSAGGSDSMGELDFRFAKELGIHWDRPFEGPFNWQRIERVPGTYDFSDADEYVQAAAENDLIIAGILWPFADWDQVACRPVSCNTPSFGNLAVKRCLPCNQTAYHAFVRATVSRYSNNSRELPVKYWEVFPEPSIRTASRQFFKGDVKDYLTLLELTSSAIREACEDCQILLGSMAGFSPEHRSYFQDVMAGGAETHFDIAALHSFNEAEDGRIGELSDFLRTRNLFKEAWLTGYSIGSGEFPPSDEAQYRDYFITDEEQALILTEGFVKAFAADAEKVFYRRIQAMDLDTKEKQSEALVTSRGQRRPVFKALKTLVKKLNVFQSVRRVKANQYVFEKDAYRKTYVLWGETGDRIPSELEGRVLVTTHLGVERMMDAQDIELTEAPIYVESVIQDGKDD